MIETIELAPGYRIPRIVRGGWLRKGDAVTVMDAPAVEETVSRPAT